MNDAITPFILAVPQADIEDLNRATTRPAGRTWRQSTTGPDAPLAKVKALIDHRRHRTLQQGVGQGRLDGFRAHGFFRNSRVLGAAALVRQVQPHTV